MIMNVFSVWAIHLALQFIHLMLCSSGGRVQLHPLFPFPPAVGTALKSLTRCQLRKFPEQPELSVQDLPTTLEIFGCHHLLGPYNPWSCEMFTFWTEVEKPISIPFSLYSNFVVEEPTNARIFQVFFALNATSVFDCLVIFWTLNPHLNGTPV